MIRHLYSRLNTIARLRIGPFGKYVDGFVRCLMEQGYSSCVIRPKIRAIEDFGNWLGVRHAQVYLFDEDDIRKFIESVRRR